MNRTLTALSISGPSINDHAACALASALKLNLGLRFLSISGDLIGDSGAMALVDAFRINSSLDNFEIDGFNISTKGLYALRDSVRDHLLFYNVVINGYTSQVFADIQDILTSNQWRRRTHLIDTNMAWQRFHTNKQKGSRYITKIITQFACATEDMCQFSRLPIELLAYLSDSCWLVSVVFPWD